MNDDPLKNLWKNQNLPMAKGPDMDTIKCVEAKMKKLHRTLFWRDVREVVAGIIVVISYGMIYRHAPTTLAAFGCLFTIGAAIFVTSKIIYTRRVKPQAEPASEASTREFLQVEIGNVTTQIKLLQSVLWWYLLPFFVGVELYAWGMPGGWADKLVSLTVMVLVYAFIYWLNLYAARKSLMPVRSELEKALAALN